MHWFTCARKPEDLQLVLPTAPLSRVPITCEGAYTRSGQFFAARHNTTPAHALVPKLNPSHRLFELVAQLCTVLEGNSSSVNRIAHDPRLFVGEVSVASLVWLHNAPAVHFRGGEGQQ